MPVWMTIPGWDESDLGAKLGGPKPMGLGVEADHFTDWNLEKAARSWEDSAERNGAAVVPGCRHTMRMCTARAGGGSQKRGFVCLRVLTDVGGEGSQAPIEVGDGRHRAHAKRPLDEGHRRDYREVGEVEQQHVTLMHAKAWKDRVRGHLGSKCACTGQMG